MKRRDISAALIGAAGVALASREARATECAAPCYPRDTATEPSGVTVNTAWPKGNVLRYGADPTGSANSTQAFNWALECNGTAFVPIGQYAISEVVLGQPGRTLRGESRYDTRLRPYQSGKALICNTSRLVGSTTGHAIENLHFELFQGSSNVACTGVDLGSVGNTVVRNCRFTALGGAAPKNADGVLFDAPLNYGSYSNSVVDCDFTNMANGVLFASNANNNMVIGGEFIHCTNGINAAPAGSVDSPKVYGARIEGCWIGLLDRASQGMYFGLRFEDNAHADVKFFNGSNQAQFFGGLTATSPVRFRDTQYAYGLVCLAPDLHGNVLIGDNVLAPSGSTGDSAVPAGMGTVAAYVRGGRMVLDNSQWLVSPGPGQQGIQYLIMGSAAGVVEVGASGKVDVGNTSATHRTRIFKPSFLMSGSGVSGAAINKFPVYDNNGTLVGYVPIHAS